jgi:hypothetical protein
MLIIDQIEDTRIILLLNEAATFLGRNETPVDVEATPDTGPLLLSARVDRSGNMWLGGWRRAVLPAVKGEVTLKPTIVYSDKMCRDAAASTCSKVTKAHNDLGQVPVIRDKEILVTGRGLPTYVIPARWLKPRGRGHRRPEHEFGTSE